MSASHLSAEEPVRLEERFASGDQYSVQTRTEVAGTLRPPAEKGKPAPPPVAISGNSAIDYDERVLTVTDRGEVRKTVRICRRVDFQRSLDDRPERSTLRPAVRRLVLLREGHDKAPFSPDGPLTWGEIDLVRTDIFVPVLAGLLPSAPVRPGDSWSASTEVVQELTGLLSVDEGRLECRFESVASNQARISLNGTVRGRTEDGTSRQQLKGHFFFDLDARRIVAVELRGVHSLLTKEGTEVGRIEGRFVLNRRLAARPAELTDDGLRGVALDPNAENSLLLFENSDLGVRFLHPRRWRVAAAGRNQIALDAPDGSGILMTIESAARTPTAAQFLNESRDYLQGQKARILRTDPPRAIPGDPPREQFALEVEMGGQKFLMDYHVSRQTLGGVLLAARLLPGDQTALRNEVERIARTVVVIRRIEAPK